MQANSGQSVALLSSATTSPRLKLDASRKSVGFQGKGPNKAERTSLMRRQDASRKDGTLNRRKSDRASWRDQCVHYRVWRWASSNDSWRIAAERCRQRLLPRLAPN